MILESLRNDPSLRYNETGRALLRLLALHTMSPAGWEQLISAVPLHRAQAVAQVARSSSEAWQEFARRLEYVTQHSVTGALTKLNRSDGLLRPTGCPGGHDLAELADRHHREFTGLVVVQLHREPVLYPDGQLGESERLQVCSARAQLRIVVDALNVVIHRPQ
jgi:hypothetical protein